MRLALAFMCLNEADWLKLHRSVWSAYPIEGVVVVDGGSTDDTLSAAIRLHERVTVYRRPWDWKPLDQENFVIECAERERYDAILLTAPDELLFPEDVQKIRDCVQSGQVVSFPTYNFVRDRLHYAPESPYYPDVHIRAWRLGLGIRHVGVIDSVPNVEWTQTQYLPDVHLYHYSHIRDRRYYAWKSANFHRVKDGLPPLETPWQEHDAAPYPVHVPFQGAQPLNPYAVGVNAPFE